MKKPKEIIENVPKTKRRHFLTFIVFLFISTLLWLLIKLSKDYSTQSTFAINYTNIPVDKCITSPTNMVNFSFDADGFITLAHNLMPENERTIDIPLNEVPYRNDNETTYSFSSQYVAEKLANLLGISTSDISMNEGNISFEMEPLKSKKVAVKLRSNIDTQRQYGIYGSPSITPNTVVVYGPPKTIDTLSTVYTKKFEKSDVNKNINETVALDLLDGLIKTDSTNVRVSISIEKFTELNIEVPITKSPKANIRVLPETVMVKSMVPMSEYNYIKPEMFNIGIDETQIGKEQIIDVVVKKIPDNVTISSIKPEQVEYLIVK